MIANAAVNQLDIQGADLRAVTFENCWIGTLIVDETTRVSPSCPVPDRVRHQGVGAKGDSVLEAPEEIMEWLDGPGRLQPAAGQDETDPQDQTDLVPSDLRDDELVMVLERACRNRAYWIPRDSDNDDQFAKFVSNPRWSEVLDLLKEHDLVREARLSSSGRTNMFVHIKRRTNILTADPKDAQIRNLYSSLVEKIRGHGRPA